MKTNRYGLTGSILYLLIHNPMRTYLKEIRTLSNAFGLLKCLSTSITKLKTINRVYLDDLIKNGPTNRQWAAVTERVESRLLSINNASGYVIIYSEWTPKRVNSPPSHVDVALSTDRPTVDKNHHNAAKPSIPPYNFLHFIFYQHDSLADSSQRILCLQSVYKKGMSTTLKWSLSIETIRAA